MPRHQNQVNFDPYTKTSSFPIPTLKSSQFRSLLYQVQSRTQTKSISIQTLKPSHFPPPHQNQANSDSYIETKSSLIPNNEIKSISTTYTKTKSSSMLMLKPSGFRPACKKQVNFDHPHLRN